LGLPHKNRLADADKLDDRIKTICLMNFAPTLTLIKEPSKSSPRNRWVVSLIHPFRSPNTMIRARCGDSLKDVERHALESAAMGIPHAIAVPNVVD
jgi:hypothetical protein